LGNTNAPKGSETRKLRGFNLSKIKPLIHVYFPGDFILGQPYMVIIPFFISGKVTLETQVVRLNHYYHIYGNCQLRIENEQNDEGKNDEGKLGVWAYMLSS
jgi:hypothetical protein